MKEFFRSNLVLIIPIIFGILALFAWLHPFNSERISLVVSINQNVELKSNSNLSKNGYVEFIYNGQRVQNLISTRIRFKNDGNKPLEKSDFIKGIDIIFPKGTRIVNETIIQTQPLVNSTISSQELISGVSDNQLTFIPILINPDDIFDLDILTTRDGVNSESLSYGPDQIILDYKIYNISKIEKLLDIKTNAEKRTEARQGLSDGWKQLKPAVIILVIFIILGWFIPAYFPNIYKKKESTSLEIKKDQSWMFFAFIALLIVLIFLYFIFNSLYNAFILSV